MLSSTKTLGEIAVGLLIKGAAFGAMETQHNKRLHMLPYAFNLRHWRHSRVGGWWSKVWKETTWMSVYLIGYSKDWLCDCQHLTEKGKHDNRKKPESAVVVLLPCLSAPHPPPLLGFFQSSSPSPLPQFSAPRGLLQVRTFLQAVMKSLQRDIIQPTAGL